jgi:hypothetical protein
MHHLPNSSRTESWISEKTNGEILSLTRAGFVVAAAEKEMPLGTVMWLSGHRSGESVWRYQRPVTMESMLMVCEDVQR